MTLMLDLGYDFPVPRPMGETNSVIFQVTLGCSFNKCSFCNLYRTKKYTERPWEDIKKEIDLVSEAYPESSRIFLADGDALNLSTEKLRHILKYIKQKFRKLERISCYAMPKNLIQKNHEQLASINKEGLDRLYVGLETGYDVLLKKITKGATSQGLIQACNKAKKSGFILECMFILGLGGKRYSKEHIKETARVVSEVSPNFLVAFPLIFEEGVYREFMDKFGEPFEHVDDFLLLDEIEMFLNLVKPCSTVIFRANHKSNAYTITGSLPEDKDKMISSIISLKEHPEMLKPQLLRRI